MNKVILLFVSLLIGIGGTVNAGFTCVKQGLFANPDTSDCTSFIVCDSNLQSKIRTCPGNMYFWPSYNGCFSYYNCSTNSSPYITNPCAGFRNDALIDKFATNCSSFISCQMSYVYNIDSTQLYTPVYGTVITCDSGYTFQTDKRGCVSNSQCVNYQCTQEGYFQNPNKTDCSSFIMCVNYTSDNNNARYLYPLLEACPPDTKFSPFTRKCDQYYTCGGTDKWNGTDPCLNYNWANPVAANPFVNNCTSYLGCTYYTSDYKTIDVILNQTCPAKTFFSPIFGKCYYNYECNQKCSKDPCGNGPGKFVDYKSGYCEGYIECRDDSTVPGTYRPTYEKRYCPPGTNFSPNIRDCDKDYKCPQFAVDYCYPIVTTTQPPTLAPSGK